MSVSQDMKVCRVFLKPLAEIKHMTVGITLAQNRYKAENICRISETFRICRKQAFTCKLAGSVKRCLNRKWCVLGGGYNLRLAVYLTR